MGEWDKGEKMATTNQTVKADEITMTVVLNLIRTSTTDDYGRITAYTFNTDSNAINCISKGGFNHYPMTTWPQHHKPTQSQALRAKIIDQLEDTLCNGIKNLHNSPAGIMELMKDLACLRSARTSFYSNLFPESNTHIKASKVFVLAQKYALPITDTGKLAEMLRTLPA